MLWLALHFCFENPQNLRSGNPMSLTAPTRFHSSTPAEGGLALREMPVSARILSDDPPTR